MIQKIRKSRYTRHISVFLILNILSEILAPTVSLALTGGPSQPEFSSFTPVGTSDLVDLSSGDFSYNIPLVDVGGYPINIAYSSGISADDEASWVGLGWNLSVGQINRNVRGLPDDFMGDEMTYENNSKPNITVGADFKFSPNLYGVQTDVAFNEEDTPLSMTVGLSAMYNNYTGFSIKKSLGIQMELGDCASVGFNAQSGDDGLSLSPNVSLHSKEQEKGNRINSVGANFGVGLNSRQGLTSTSFGIYRKSSEAVKSTRKVKNADGKDEDKEYTKRGATHSASVGSSISYAENSYTPSGRVAMRTESFTVNAALGGEIFGAEGQGQITAFGTIQYVAENEYNKKVRAFGYQHTDKANHTNMVDFNREKDGPVTENSTNLAVTNYSYDIYSVQGQGVSGMYRPYRNTVGYVFDPFINDMASSGTIGVELGGGNAVHSGVDFENATTSTSSGMWENNNYILQYLKENYNYNPRYEKIHYKNVGDFSTDGDFQIFDQTASYQPVRVAWEGSDFNRKAVAKLKYKASAAGSETEINAAQNIRRSKRKTRNQAIYPLVKGQVDAGVGYGPCVKRENYVVPRYELPSEAKSHHTAEVQVVRNDGARYIYGLPAYNLVKKEATFSVTKGNANLATGLVSYMPGFDNTIANQTTTRNFNRVTTPAYAHTYLLTSVLSADYQDLTNDGPSDDDPGNYTRIDYEKKALYKWRVPFQAGTATYNAGLNTDPDDDQGNYVYGEKEQYYVKEIVTKTHIAKFFTSPRHDNRGVIGENGGPGGSSSYKLDRIELYSRKDPDHPLKMVNFEYAYDLCKSIPNNDGLGENNAGGKLTLKKIYFTYRNSAMGKYSAYTFDYNNSNPDYNIKAYDFWGNYKPSNSSGLNADEPHAAEYAYANQNKDTQDENAAVWNLSTIHLPSGGQIDVEYESDDYAYVQDKRALRMFKIAGIGSSETPSDLSGATTDLFSTGLANTPKTFMYVQLPSNLRSNLSTAEIQEMFFNQLPKKLVQFRCYVNMSTPSATASTASELNGGKFDYVSGYLRPVISSAKIIPSGGVKYLSFEVNTEDLEGRVNPHRQVHPISKAAWNFGRKYLSRYVYGNAPSDENAGIGAIANELVSSGMIGNLMEVFNGPNVTLENKLIGRRIIKNKSFIRLGEPTGCKLGGGLRVKTVKSSDNWNSMSPASAPASYGQQYSYKLPVNGPLADTKMSSGVATYESIGNKENPFVEPVFSSVKHLLAPDEENYAELPFGESFFPSPQVTYSMVTVSSMLYGAAPAGKQYLDHHRTGKVVHEFYTSKDYPTLADYTRLDAKEDWNKMLDNLLKKYSRRHMIASQGFVIHLNDMNGKQKAQWVYAEGQSEPISGVEYKYSSYSSGETEDVLRNKGQLNNNVKVIYPNGSIAMKTIGVESDIVHDFRENISSTDIQGVNTNVAAFVAAIIPVIVPVPLPDASHSEIEFRSVSTTKVINTFGILSETIAYDAGSEVHTKNLAYDALTGEVLVTETVDEFNDAYYTFNYPAHWFYKGMGQAANNLGFEGTLQAVTGGYNMTGIGNSFSSDYLIAGDEIVYGTAASNGLRGKAWVSEVQGNLFKLINAAGNPVTNASGNFTVIRSGYRNLQSAGIMNVVLMKNPLKSPTGANISNLGQDFLAGANATWQTWKIINAGAVDYSDNWPAGCECGIGRTNNPFLKNERGTWRTKSSQAYLTGRNTQSEVTPRQQGFMNTFSPFYRLSAGGNWIKNTTGWQFVSEVSIFNPFGFENENRDPLNRYSAAQYGYNNSFPVAVAANSQYREIGFDGFEDHLFTGCSDNSHFSFQDAIGGTLQENISHTGKYSIKVLPNSTSVLSKKIDCRK